MRTLSRLLIAAVCSAVFGGLVHAAEPGKLTVDVGKPGVKIDPMFYGLMTEEINHAYDGGLYAELIQNRIFQDNADRIVAWSVVKGGSSNGTIALDAANPVNDVALKKSLRLDITALESGQRVGVANDGFWGIPAWPNTKYHASFYARASEGSTGPLQVSIESNEGGKALASAQVPAISTQWKKYEVDLTTGDAPASTTNKFVISASGKGSVWFSLVSLFPPTY